MRDREKARQKAKELVAQMTLEERASQLRYDAPAIPRLGVPTYNWWNEALHGVARAGVATSFPQAIAMAAAFDEELLKTVETRWQWKEGQNTTNIPGMTTGISTRD